jgi:uncharacterized protein (DUF433 family)
MSARAPELNDIEAAIHRASGVMGGEAVFKGTRVPVALVRDRLADGASEAESLEGYPSLNARLPRLAKVWKEDDPRERLAASLASEGFRLKSVVRFDRMGDPGRSAAKSRTPV